MSTWISRIILAIGFLAVVWLVAKPTVQGQTPTDGRVWMPQLVGRAAFTFAPPLRDYIGLVERGGTYHSVRGDGSEYILQVENVSGTGWTQWSPDGAYLFTNRTVDGTTGVWITRLADQQSWRVTSIFGFMKGWSPDSRQVVFTGNDALYRYDVEADFLTSFPSVNQDGYGPVTWTPDSSTFAGWVTLGPSPNVPNWSTSLLTIVGEDGGRHEVFTGTAVYRPLAWSPDSQRLLFNVWEEGIQGFSVYETDRHGSPAELLIEGYSVVGFMDNGIKILLLQGQHLFLANADGSDLQPLTTDERLRFEGPAIAPTGDKIVYISQQGMVLQNTQGQVVVIGGYCGMDSIQWRSDGEMFTCAASSSETVIVDATFNEGDSRTDIEDRISPQFLPLMKNSLLLTGGYYDYSPGYPVWHYEGHFLFDLQSGSETLLEYPTSDESPIVQWRYMP